MRQHLTRMRTAMGTLFMLIAATGMLACSDSDSPPPPDTCDGGECPVECEGDDCMDMGKPACTAGEADCECRSNGACDEGLRCSSDKCETCPAGSEMCPCATGDSCNGDLECMNDVCAPAACTAGTRSCPCGSGDSCDGTDMCGSDGICRACADDVPGCPCSSGDSCSGGLLCNSGTCVDRVTCAELVSGGDCGANQACDEATPAADAECVDATCKTGYIWDTASSSCVMPSMTGDGDMDNDAGMPMCDQCDADNRVCLGDNMCGDCAEGFIFDSLSDACVPELKCGDATCQQTEYCDQLDGSGPTCKALPCSGDQYQRMDGSCAACLSNCAGERGLTGRPWALADLNNSCVCETKPGFFIPPGGLAGARPCDEDGDGWVNAEAYGSQVEGDEALLQNRRCSARYVDRVALRDEYGLEQEIYSCQETGMALTPATTAGEVPAGCTVKPIRLEEARGTDRPLNDKAADMPEYGTRFLAGDELNALTKACVQPIADYNQNGMEDVDEVQYFQPAARRNVDLSNQQRLNSFAYFTELYRSYYEAPGDPADLGRLVLEERRRCAADGFPLLVGANDTNAYWRSCYRRRAKSYDESANDLVGHDFAQWTCNSATQSCPAALPPVDVALDTGMPDQGAAYMSDMVLGHDLCSAGASPADGVWRGMGHHSQFQCVKKQAGSITTYASVLNVCQAVDCSSASGACAEVGPELTSYANPADTNFTCQVVTSTVFDVGWAIADFVGYADPVNPANTPSSAYERGCVDESAEWGYLCRDYYDPTAKTSSPIASTYGQLTCPCDGTSDTLNGCISRWGNLSSPTPDYELLVWDQGVWQ